MDDFEAEYCKIFNYMHFPLIKLTKLDIKNISEKGEWINLLRMTWFCATRYKGKPCGFCGPCTYAIDEGLARRLPFLEGYYR